MDNSIKVGLLISPIEAWKNADIVKVPVRVPKDIRLFLQVAYEGLPQEVKDIAITEIFSELVLRGLSTIVQEVKEDGTIEKVLNALEKELEKGEEK